MVVLLGVLAILAATNALLVHRVHVRNNRAESLEVRLRLGRLSKALTVPPGGRGSILLFGRGGAESQLEVLAGSSDRALARCGYEGEWSLASDYVVVLAASSGDRDPTVAFCEPLPRL